MAGKEIAKQENIAKRFTDAIVNEFNTSVDAGMKFTSLQKKLAQDLFIKIDATLNDLEAKRLQSGKQGSPITWANINMQKLAIDAAHRINLGLDGLIPNHIHPIPYFNSKHKKYDLDLQIGYVGKDYYKRNMATVRPVDIIYELVYSKDKFTVFKKGSGRDVETYSFEIVNPFDRGEIVGGFGYIVFENPVLNKLVLVSEKMFLESKKAAKSKTFWDANPDEMRYKTLVHRTTDHLTVDPEKVNGSYAAVEDSEIELLGSGDVIDIETKNEIEAEQNSKPLDVSPDPEGEKPWEDPVSYNESKFDYSDYEDGPGF